MKRFLQIWIVGMTLWCTNAHAADASNDNVRDAASGITFDTRVERDGTEYRCIAAGVRRLFFVKVYAMSFCVDAATSAALAQLYAPPPGESRESHAEKLQNDAAFYDALVTAPGPKMMVMYMLRDVGREKLASAFKDSLNSVLSRDKIDRRVATIPGDMHRDDQVYIFTNTGGTLHIDLPHSQRSLQDDDVAQKLWRVWLGPDSVAPSIKEDIARWAASSLAAPAAALN